MKTPLTPESLREKASKGEKQRLRRAYGEFVARWDWEWFATFTFKYATHPERAIKLFKVWRSVLNQDIYGKRWYKREPYGVRTVLAVEHHKSGQIHLHALIAGVGDKRRLTWMDKWEGLDHLAGFPRIFAVENNDAVSIYLTKYVTKDGDVYLSRNLRIESRDLLSAAPSPESST